MTRPVPPSFEASHAEWLRIGGQTFRDLQRFGPRPDFYRSQYWKLVKEAVLTSREFKCCRCNGDAAQVHHLNYDCVGEDHLHPETLVAICRPCHGLVEYARKAESLMSRISRRSSLCKGFLEDRRGCLDQNAAHLYARLLEYQDELAELRKLFATETYYSNPRIKSQAEADAVGDRFRQEQQAYEERAANLVSTWNGSEKEKAERLLPMLKLEIEHCKEFVAEVFAPIPPRAERLSSADLAKVFARPKGRRPTEARPGSQSATPDVESLVVGIKYHRRHVDGITQGDSVQLVREPNNAYDPNAVQVNLQTGETLGYLTSEFAAVLAKQMDAGMSVQARVSRIVRDKVYVAVNFGKTAPI
jgi:hypothetical protein